MVTGLVLIGTHVFAAEPNSKPSETTSVPKESTKLGLVTDVVAIVGGVLGTFAFFWNVWDSWEQFLHVDLSLTQTHGFVLANTVVENKGTRAKKIDKAFVLVGPEDENPVDTLNSFSLSKLIEYVNDLEEVTLLKPVYGTDGRAIIPIDFYYSENINIADEKIFYEVPIPIGNALKQ